MALLHKASAFLFVVFFVLSDLGISAQDFDPQRYLSDIKFLAAPEMHGRRTGTPELEKAAGYIASDFERSGLTPLGGNYLQAFDVTERTAFGPDDSLVVENGPKRTNLKQTLDFVPLSLSSDASVHGGVVFAGYGITAPEYHYDDYKHLDVKGKIVIVLRHEPQENDEKSVFAGKILTIHSEISSKVANAKLHGAVGLLLVNDLANHPGDEDRLERFFPETITEDFGLVVDQITAKTADMLLEQSGVTVGGLLRYIDGHLASHSFILASSLSLRMNVNFQQENRTVHNVVGFLPGASSEYIVVGAHYDHLGRGGPDSLAPSQIGVVHPGADDNASGTAGVMELAHSLAQSGKHKRGFLFVCFAGEEEGLLGSAYYVNHPLVSLNDAVAMINMDMIGRVRDRKVYVGGIGTGSSFKAVVSVAAAKSGLTEDESEVGGYGASDHTSFTAKRIPTLFFFSGLHSDYHKPSDTWDKINVNGAVDILKEVSAVVVTIADAPNRPTFLRVQSSPHSGSLPSTQTSGYGPYFGSVPDFGSPSNGVRFSDVRDGSPAAKAGLKAGDTLVQFGEKPIQNLYDFTYALREHKPGDLVPVKVLRDGKALQVNVTLTKRP